jgi:hypothetical protein
MNFSSPFDWQDDSANLSLMGGPALENDISRLADYSRRIETCFLFTLPPIFTTPNEEISRFARYAELLKNHPFPYVRVFYFHVGANAQAVSFEASKEFLTIMSTKALSLLLKTAEDELENCFFQQFQELVLSCSHQLSEICFAGKWKASSLLDILEKAVLPNRKLNSFTLNFLDLDTNMEEEISRLTNFLSKETRISSLRTQVVANEVFDAQCGSWIRSIQNQSMSTISMIFW